jgi:hypothetical protein
VPLLFKSLDHPPFLDLCLPLDVCPDFDVLAHHLELEERLVWRMVDLALN